MQSGYYGQVNRRERVLSLAATDHLEGDGVPAAFFLHFPGGAHTGSAAIDSHLRYFEQTGNDIVKVQYEHEFPTLPEIAEGADWSGLPVYGKEFFAAPLEVVRGVVERVKQQAPVIVTLYSAYMFAQQTVGRDALRRQMAETPENVAIGLRTIVESMRNLIEGCIDAGVDGFYVSTQGGEEGLIPDGTFERYVMLWDRAVWEVIGSSVPFTVLHICDYEAPYASIDRYIDYPGHIVSAPTRLSGGTLTGAEIGQAFGRPFMGGMERLGNLSKGPISAIEAEARQAIADGPNAMVLGADCTLSSDTPWENITAATSVAHASGRDR